MPSRRSSFSGIVLIQILGARAPKQGGVDMATQIAPTPVVKGTAAVKIYKEANQKRSQASKNGAEKLKTKFSKKLK